MLYIFHVDTGTMMTFEMNLALETVSHLKEVIERACRIPPEKQVLLVSGGESLEPSARVCSYAAGTDTNPIFLFSKCTIESVSPPSPSIDYGTDMDLKEQVDASLAMSASYSTVVVRAQLAQQFCELARDQTRICERLVHDQHLQQQGWAAVVANLEDSVAVFRNRGEMFEQSYQQHLESRTQYIDVLENFNEVLNTLSKIPILPGLLASAAESMVASDAQVKNCSSNNEKHQDDATSAMSPNQTCEETEMTVLKKSNSDCCEDWSRQHEEKAITLLQWISTKDNQSTLEQMVEQCARGLEQFDERVLEVLRADVESALEAANKADMKEIKGLEERLYGLEQLMFESKRIVQEQSDLATAFHQNQTRANNLGDASILPDLCASHRRQLLVMLKNHHQLRDIRRRCNRAKEELSVNLYHRLKWIMYVENKMCDVASKLMIYHENLKRLRRHLEVIRQIQMAPQMYVCAVNEVVRRRTFSEAFLTWASDLASKLQTVHSEELARRRNFQSRFEGHFLNNLFSGMKDIPPPFATQTPLPFDTSLPKLTKEDVEKLNLEVPHLAASLSVSHSANFIHIFNKSLNRTISMEQKRATTVEKSVATVCASDSSLAAFKNQGFSPADSSNICLSPNSLPLKDDRGFESETDTEEFEKVGQSPSDVVPLSSVGATIISKENHCNAQAHDEQSHAQLRAVKKIVSAATDALQTELSHLRGHVETEKSEFMKLVNLYRVTWEQLLSAWPVDHASSLEAQLDHEKRKGEAKDTIIQNLTQSVEERTATVEQLEASLRHHLKVEEEQRVHTEELQRRLENASNSTNQSNAISSADKSCPMNELDEGNLFSVGVEKHSDDSNKGGCEELNCALEDQKASLELLHNQKLEEIKLQAEAEKKQALKELTDKLSRDYHSQLEGLRSRFRLMACASMERSPSDSSLEKIETSCIRSARGELDVEAIQREKDRAIQVAVQDAEKRVQAEWESKLQIELQNTRLKMEAEKQVWFNEAVRHVLEDNKRQLEILRTREAALRDECGKHRETIRRLTEDANNASGDVESNGALWQLLDRVDQLEAELATAKTQTSMGISVAVLPSDNVSSRDAATSPEPLSLKRNLTCSANNLLQQGKINILSCMPGDAVLVVWNDNHQNYVILQESSTLYFVHSGCLDSLGLSLTADSGKRKFYSTAEVIEKEYCHARKSENRYRVPKGAKFYRVKVRPLQEDSFMSKSSHRHRDRHQHLPNQQHHSHQHPDDVQKVDVSLNIDNKEVSSRCFLSGPPSGSGCCLQDTAITEASQ